jgi:hypothetical protein
MSLFAGSACTFEQFRKLGSYRLDLHMKLKLISRTVGVIAFAVSLVSLASEIDEQPDVTIASTTGVFIVYGDIRFTDPSHCAVSSVYARKALVDQVSKISARPDFVLLTGDIVYHGDDANDWAVFDNETKPFRNQNLRVLSVLGNHDVRGNSGQRNFVEHFDELKKHEQLKKNGWYSMDYGSSHFVMLDSQSSYAEQLPQGAWLRKQLKGVPEDLDFLIVVLHHPLVTHASRTPFRFSCDGQHTLVAGHDVEDAEQSLKGVLENFSRTHPQVRVLVFSGHNHNYERYVVNNITYVVTGGGGATPYRIVRGPKDLYREPGPTYHYCRLQLVGHSLKFQMFKLKSSEGNPEWEMKDAFEMNAQMPNSTVPPPH